MKKFSLTTLPLLLAAVAPLCADSTGNKKTNTQSMQTTQPTNQITPSANPMVTHWCDPYLTADFIWWRVEQDGMNFATSGTEPLAQDSVTLVNAGKGHVAHPRFKYEPGFKVGFGVKFRHDGWDMYANYTWLRTDFGDTKKSLHAKTTSGIAATTELFGTLGVALPSVTHEAEGKWSLHFNALDIELGRNYWISQWLTLRPHFGMKFSWLDQDYHVEYEGISTPTFDVSIDASNVRIHNDIDQFGVGLRTGLDTAWYLWKKWCIFGEFAVSALWNDFDVKRKDTTQTAIGSFTTLNTKFDSHSVSAVIEIALGLRFETTFHNDDYLFMLQAGWEEQIWFNQNQFFNPLSQSPQDLTFEGLTIKAGFDF